MNDEQVGQKTSEYFYKAYTIRRREDSEGWVECQVIDGSETLARFGVSKGYGNFAEQIAEEFVDKRPDVCEYEVKRRLSYAPLRHDGVKLINKKNANMSTRANVLVRYIDRRIGASSELWLFHRQDGYVQGIGEQVVQVVRDLGLYVDDGDGLNRLWDEFPSVFENISVDMSEDIDFLYRITYADNAVTVVARHGGYVGERAPEHYSEANDTADNSVELLHMAFKDGRAVSENHDIREPESYVRTLRKADQPGARAWRGRLL